MGLPSPSLPSLFIPPCTSLPYLELLEICPKPLGPHRKMTFPVCLKRPWNRGFEGQHNYRWHGRYRLWTAAGTLGSLKASSLDIPELCVTDLGSAYSDSLSCPCFLAPRGAAMGKLCSIPAWPTYHSSLRLPGGMCKRGWAIHHSQGFRNSGWGAAIVPICC